MARELIPGIRQDHKGKLYLVARFPGSSKTIAVPAEQPAPRAFQFRFSSSEGGHVWTFDKRVSVRSCGRSGCLVCGSKRVGSWYLVEEGE